jgi:outer membrane biosynthesis protein TonB
MEKPSKKLKKTPPKNQKKAPATKPKKVTDSGKTSQKPKVALRQKVSSSKTSRPPQKNRGEAPTRAESQHTYFEVLGSRIANRAYELYLQRGQEHGHDLEDWLEAERQILPKEIAERS